MIIAGNIEGDVTGRGDRSNVVLPKYARTAFDYIVIAAGYLFMPLGLLLAFVRLIGSHYKNYRKPVNYSLFYHVFVGGFVEMIGLLIFGLSGDAFETAGIGTLIGLLIFFSLLLLLPASAFASTAAKSRYQFLQLAVRYVEQVAGSGITHIGNLAGATGQSEGDVRRDLLYLQSCGVLDSSLIFEEGQSTASARSSAQASRSSVYETSGAPGGFGGAAAPSQSPPQLPKSIRCPGCGAQNTVNPGQSKSCDYCGTTIAYS